MGDTNDGSNFGRRVLLGGGAAALGAGLVGIGTPAAARPADAGTAANGNAAGRRASVRAAISFLQGVTDAYRPSGMRLAQSYMDDSGLTDTAFIYDNALVAMALIAAGDLARAQAIGDALLYAQNHDESFDDGRLRQAYHAKDFVNQNKTAHFGWEYQLTGTAVGDMAWTGIALAQLARRVPEGPYLDGALTIGRWVLHKTHSTTGLGGYTFGETAGLETHKSSEHNIDVYAFFRLLARLTRDDRWHARAEHAWRFVEKMWNADAGFFWTGSDEGSTVNKNPKQLPLDVQTWAWLAARRGKYSAGMDWAATNLATTDTPLRINSALTGNDTYTGVAFASGTFRTDVTKKVDNQEWTPYPDDGGVWFEGTAQLALALRDRGRSGDHARADQLLETIRRSQHNLGSGQTFGQKRIEGGIQAASSPIDTGYHFAYHPHLHTAATSWYVFAATGFNPYRLS